MLGQDLRIALGAVEMVHIRRGQPGTAHRGTFPSLRTWPQSRRPQRPDGAVDVVVGDDPPRGRVAAGDGRHGAEFHAELVGRRPAKQTVGDLRLCEDPVHEVVAFALEVVGHRHLREHLIVFFWRMGLPLRDKMGWFEG